MKSNNLQSIIFLLTFSIILTGCKKDEIIPFASNNNPDTSSNTLYSGVNVSTSLGGLITNQSGNPVPNALVTIGNKTTYTNQFGIFSLKNITVDEKRAYVKIEKPGYFLGSRSFKPNTTNSNYIRIELIPKTMVGKFSNNSGGTININGSAQLTFESGDVSLANGNAYNGTVFVYAAYLDPLASNIGEIMPGDLTAVDESNNEVVLETYGMIAVELIGANGEKLNVTPGKSVTIKIEVANQQLSAAPSTIPLWHFDETFGNWTEEGEASLQDGFYVGQVSHFSFWNCDAPFPVIDFHCRLVCNNTPINSASIKITTPSGSSSTGYTNINGEASGKVPKNTTIIMEVINQCGEIIHTQTISPSAGNIELGNVQICNGNNSQGIIYGKIVDCNGNGISNGLLRLSAGGTNTINIFTDQNGLFNSVISTCTVQDYELIAYNFNNNQQSSPVSIQINGTSNLGIITTCDQMNEFIYFTLDNIEYAILESGQNEVHSAYHSDSIVLYGNYNSNDISISIPTPTLGINSCQVNYVNSTQIEAPSEVDINFTSLGTTPGSYIEGTFSGIVYSSGNPHNVFGNFRSKNE